MRTYTSAPAEGAVTICRQQTGKDWCNFLWNEGGYQCEVTHTGASSAKFVANTSEAIVLNEPKSGVIYFRDEETGEYWSAGGWPCAAPVHAYSCRHGQCASFIRSEHADIAAETAYAVSDAFLHEVWRVTVKNTGARPRRVGVIAGTVFRMDGYAMPFYYNAFTTSETMYLPESCAVLCRSQNPYAHFDAPHGFVMASERPFAFEGDADRFTGVCGGLARPLVLEERQDLSCSCATVRPRCGLLQHKFTLAAGEARTLYYFVGFCAGEAALASQRAAMLAEAEGLFAAARGERFGRLRTRCPEERFNTLFNFWAEKQVTYCAIGKKAVRDNAQLAMGFLNFDTRRAKATLAECLAHQYEDGHCVLLWYPVTDTKLYSDPAFWLVWAVCEYIKETGDFSFLQEEYPWLGGGAAPVSAHLKAAAQWYADVRNQGAHGLPKLYYADWNDALNIPDEGAESVFMAECVCLMMRELADLFGRAGDAAFAAFAQEQRAAMAERLNACAWNGDYYVRAFSSFGTVGDKGCECGKFYINAQSFAILAGVVPQERMQALLRAVDGAVTPEGVRLCSPPYRHYDPHVGRMSGMLPGVYENGGIYNHAGCFKVMADCLLGRAEEAFASLSAIVPDGAHNPSSRTTVEPYVFVNCYLKHPAVDMRCSASWQTGTSAWGLRCYYEGLLGIRREYGGLRIVPCLPAAWKEAYAERDYRGSRLCFFYRKGNGNGVRVYVDGKAVRGQLVPPQEGGTHTVEVEF